MKKTLFIITVLITFSLTAQEKSIAKKDQDGNLIGYIKKVSLLDKSYSKWFTKNYDAYKTDKKIIRKIKKKLKKYTIKGFFGTWCGDSKREVPRFYKILEEAAFDMNRLEMIALNRSKKTLDSLQKGYDIIRVPTFIFYKHGKETGRFVEYPVESLEKDMLKILTTETYKHSYQE
ncbi:MAG: thioredoxin [Flavobacteriaceae bacterium]|nr:MAG: thioredoxin [Flavobacteriaceae bacterium]